MELYPISLKEANAFVLKHHRHNEPVVGHKYSVSVREGGEVCGVAICGRPIARHLDDGLTIEILRTCTDGTPNANSKLYGASTRVAFALGYKRVITYTLQSELGSSLKASGFQLKAITQAQHWGRQSRPRTEKLIDQETKHRWEANNQGFRQDRAIERLRQRGHERV